MPIEDARASATPITASSGIPWRRQLGWMCHGLALLTWILQAIWLPYDLAWDGAHTLPGEISHTMKHWGVWLAAVGMTVVWDFLGRRWLGRRSQTILALCCGMGILGVVDGIAVQWNSREADERWATLQARRSSQISEHLWRCKAEPADAQVACLLNMVDDIRP
ncbi:MAG: hypothetical protein HQL51_07950 [Magnetococcales bacterium]|nr:hypothetical protein [Magnetococcales bacterium]